MAAQRSPLRQTFDAARSLQRAPRPPTWRNRSIFARMARVKTPPPPPERHTLRACLAALRFSSTVSRWLGSSAKFLS